MRIYRIQTVMMMLLALTFSAITIQAQGKPPLSPPGTAEIALDGKKVTIAYGRPSMRGRKIFGDVVPFDKVWRTGANKATAFTTEVDLMFGTVVVPAGSYTLFTLPTPTGWKLIINKHTGQWGIPYKPEYEQEELARIDMKVGKTAAPVELFTITMTAAKNGGVIKMEWETTSASINFKVKK